MYCTYRCTTVGLDKAEISFFGGSLYSADTLVKWLVLYWMSLAGLMCILSPQLKVLYTSSS